MGNADTKLHFRKAVLQLTTKTQPIPSSDDAFWNQFWGEHVSSVSDVFVLLPASEVRALRETAPSNLATLCYKAVERLVEAADTGASAYHEQQAVLNCVRILTRVLPYIFEDPDWRGFFWSRLPADGEAAERDEEALPLAHSLINALCDLLFCPDFTVTPNKKAGVDAHEDLQSLDSCEYIWEAGVGAAQAPTHNPHHDAHRKELLKLLLTCCSQTIYLAEGVTGSSSQLGLTNGTVSHTSNPWLCLFTSSSNRHALPLFTSLLNTVCGYNPLGCRVPYNHLVFSDSRESLVEVSLQILITALDIQDGAWEEESPSVPDNLFINYLSRIHREEDFAFVLRGFTRLLNNPLLQTYLPHSTKKVNFHQELLVFFWKFCDYNKKFLFYVLKSSEVLEVLGPILFHLNDARADQSRVGLLHIGVFILLLLSGERNFGVRLNKPYTAAVPMDIPVFTGSHADLMIIVFHKIITTGHQRLQPLFDCLLTILVNVSPYIKSLSMVASNKLLHLLEAFCTPWFLFSAPHHHHLVFFLLETFNNIIQYQFDGNSNLVYTLIRKRQVFHSLANLPTDAATINRTLNSRRGGAMARKWTGVGAGTGGGLKMATSMNLVKQGAAHEEGSAETPATAAALTDKGDMLADEDGVAAVGDAGKAKGGGDEGMTNGDGSEGAVTMEGATPAQQAPPGTQTCTLAALPRLDKMTEQESAHPTSSQLKRLTLPQDGEGVGASTSSASSIPVTTDLITAITPSVEAPPVLPPTSSQGAESDKVAGECPASVAVSNAADIATSFPPPIVDESRGGSATPDGGDTTAELSAPSNNTGSSGVMYPPSPHISTSVQPPSNPHQTPAYQQRRQQNGAPLSSAERREKLSSQGSSSSLLRHQRARHLSHTSSVDTHHSGGSRVPSIKRSDSAASSLAAEWSPSGSWVSEWKSKLPLQTIMRLLQVLVPQVEKICIDKGLTDESEILRFLQHGTLVGLLPVPHPILIRKYQANAATATWFRTYMWGIIYLRNVDPPIWYDTDVKLFEIQRV